MLRIPRQAEALDVGLILNGTPVRAWSAKKLSFLEFALKLDL